MIVISQTSTKLSFDKLLLCLRPFFLAAKNNFIYYVSIQGRKYTYSANSVITESTLQKSTTTSFKQLNIYLNVEIGVKLASVFCCKLISYMHTKNKKKSF